jgi:hypothetical protein
LRRIVLTCRTRQETPICMQKENEEVGKKSIQARQTGRSPPIVTSHWRRSKAPSAWTTKTLVMLSNKNNTTVHTILFLISDDLNAVLAVNDVAGLLDDERDRNAVLGLRRVIRRRLDTCRVQGRRSQCMSVDSRRDCSGRTLWSRCR